MHCAYWVGSVSVKRLTYWESPLKGRDLGEEKEESETKGREMRLYLSEFHNQEARVKFRRLS